MRNLKTDRNYITFLLLNIITCGIYAIFLNSAIGEDLNIIAARDGKKTMHYCLVYFVLAPLTLGIWGLVWFHQISERMGDELRRRGIDYNFNASTFWLWNVLGSFIFVGPIVYTVKYIKAINLLAEDYNLNG
ncbi:MAG: DUF4234 domain-containing protein [Ruminococcus sp.]|nr:DUF4234 domain-containing protein [Ruminococcus sp.]